MSLIQELKRRRVFRVAGVYLVAAWAIIQASDTIMPRLGLPDWSVTLVIALVALGAPIALILAWAFDVNVEVDRTTSTNQSVTVSAGRIAVVAAVIILAVAGVAFFSNGAADELPQRSVAVKVFENRTSDPSLAALGRMTSDFIIRGLSETGQVDVAESTKAAAVVVTGSVYRDSTGVMLVAQVSDARSGNVLRTIGPVKSAEEMRELATGGIVALVSPAGQGFVKISEGAHLPNWAAYRFYLKGVESFSTQQMTACADEFSKSYAADTLFYLSVIRQAYCLQNNAKQVAVDSIGKWFESRRERLSAFESAYLDRVLARNHGDLSGVYRASHEMLRLRPTSSNAYYIAGRDALPLNRPKEAIAQFKKIDIDDPELPRGVEIFRDYSAAYHMLGQYRKALKWAEGGLERVPADVGTQAMRGSNLAALGRLDELKKLIDDIELQSRQTGTVNSPGGALLNIAVELGAHGHAEEAKDVAGRAAVWFKTNGGTKANIANALTIAGDLDEAERVIKSDSVPNPGILGVIAALRGNRAEVDRINAGIIARDTSMAPEARRRRATMLLARAKMAAIMNDKPTAMRLLRESHANGTQFGTNLHADPYLRRLVGYKPFDEFMKPRD